jgi:hypothetical protein
MNPDELLRAMMDPTAPLPTGWPDGALGAFLLFMFPVGGGIPTGVLRARDGGIPAPLIMLMYLASDVLAAFTNEPVLRFARFLGRQIPILGLLGHWFSRLTMRTGLQGDGARGPLGLVLVSFTVSLMAGRAAAAAAGHGFLRGWSLAIAGDMLYFLLLMASTLVLSSILGDERMTVGIVLVAMFVLPSILRRRRAKDPTSTVPSLAVASPLQSAAVPAALPVRAVQAPRKQRSRRRARRR